MGKKRSFADNRSYIQLLVYKLSYIHHFQFNLVAPAIGGHGAHALLAGADHRIGPGIQGMFYLAFADLGGKPMIRVRPCFERYIDGIA